MRGSQARVLAELHAVFSQFRSGSCSSAHVKWGTNGLPLPNTWAEWVVES